MTPEPVELVADRLYALAHRYELDGRASTHPPDVRGHATMNAYLLIEDQRALLIDTGLSIHQQAILDQLGALLPAGFPLSIWLLRIGEFSSICNVRPITESFNVQTIYGGQGEPPRWVDFRPEFVPAGTPVGAGALAAVRSATVSAGGTVSIDPGGRELLAFNAPLRLLPTLWVYDERTATLFTSDSFSHALPAGEDAVPLVTDASEREGAAALLRRHLVRTRYWWLPGARTSLIREQIATIFDGRDIERIAPAYGCIFEGRDVVARERRLLDEMLVAAAAQPAAIDTAHSSRRPRAARA
ncbi:MAG: hypothetical protein Q8O56_08650 [Solirubrobacteraceae bacterium]|nr:hypothetical protein [Solirubrobacteraceae bacterium]